MSSSVSSLVLNFLRFLRHNKTFSLGLAMFMAFIILGFVYSSLAPFDPRRWNVVPRNQPPSLRYPLGTTILGQDVFWLLTWSLKNSMIIGMIGSGVGLLIGMVLGLVAGYKGGLVDRVIITLSDTFLVIPNIMIIILLASLIREQLSVPLLGLIIAFLTWSMPVRNVRSMVLSLREREFTYIAIFSGMRTIEVLFKEYMPHIFPWVSSAFINRMIGAMGTEITLAIFGLTTMDEATLGTMLYWALRYQALITGALWWILTPIVASSLLFISLYLVSMGLSEYLNPRARISRIAMG